MNVKLKVLTAGVLFFIGAEAVMAQKTKSDSVKTKNIDEVIVVGYNSKKSNEIIQAQSTVSSKELSQQANTVSLTNMLQGKAPGILVQSSNGQPGNGGNINIRGISGLGGTDPLVVIDGQYSSINQFNALNPNDIESVNIMKDAAATAQYGSRAAAGVVVVVTKRGASGKPTYSFQTRLGFGQMIPDSERGYTMMDAAQKLSWENAIADGVGIGTYTPDEIAVLSANNHDWQKDILKNSIEESYYFQASGGNDKNTYYYSLGYDHSGGLVKYIDGLKRYTARFNFDSQVSSKFKIGLNSSIQYQITQNQRDRYNGQNPFYFMYGANPYETVFDSNGNYELTGVGFPVIEALQKNLNFNKNLRLNGSLYAEYKIFDFLKFKSTVHGTYAQLKNPSIIYPGSYLDGVLGYNGWISIANNDFFNYTTNNRLDFNKSFGNHKLNLTVFHEYSQENSNFTTATKKGLSNINLNLYQLSNYTTPLTTTGSRVVTTRESLASLFDYSYAGKYFASASLRRDGSSRFGFDYQYGNFWSASVGWNIAKEKFLENSDFNTLKLRASYGTVGNDANLPDYYNKNYLSYGVYGPFPSASVVVPGNTSLKWEVAKMQNYGLDFEYAKRIKGSFEYFITKRFDFVQAVNDISQQGLLTYFTNVGDIENKGFETELSVDVIKKQDWNWNIRVNWSKVDNKVLALKNGEDERITGTYGDNVLKVGYAPFLFRMVKSAGVDSATGDALYYNLDGTITNVYSGSLAQNIYDKSPVAKGFGGFGTTLSYKALDISADFAFKYGGYAINYFWLDRLDPSQYLTNKVTDAANFWQNPGDTNVLPRPTSDGIYATDYFLQKTDYIKLRSLNIGYTFDKKFLGEAVPINSFRVFLQGQNLYTWTKFKGDPESAIGLGESNSTTATSYTFVPNSYYAYTYPIPRTYLIGFEINF